MWHAVSSTGNVLHTNTLRGLVVVRDALPNAMRFPTRNFVPLGSSTGRANPFGTTSVSNDARMNLTRDEGATDDLGNAKPHAHRCPAPCPRLARSRLQSTLIP